jgi:hypothetical protein
MMFRKPTAPRYYRPARLLVAVAVFTAATFVSAVAYPITSTKGALVRAERFCATIGPGYRVTTSTLVYATPHDPIYIDAACTTVGQRPVRLLADVHSGYVWNDRDGALYYIK